jgi:zinc transporter 9
MAAGGGGHAVVLALVGNGILTVIKLVAWVLSGSGAMLAEAVHSAADLGNQALLYVGLRQSKKGPSEHHHFGYGKDRFLFALLSAAGIFFVGCGVSVTHGVHALVSPGEHHGEAGWVVWTVLVISLVVDGVVLGTAIGEINHARKGVPWLRFLRTTDDTTTLAVLFEDGAACLGVLLAMAGIGLSTWLHLTWVDAVAAILIGLLLGGVAVFLGAINRTYLLDRAVSADVQARVLAALRRRAPDDAQATVRDVLDVKTRVIGRDVFSFTAQVELDGRALSERVLDRMQVEKAFASLQSPADLDRLLDQHAHVVVEEVGHEIDRIEKEVRNQVPGAKFIQLEVE